MQYVHGGDVYGYRLQFEGREPLDFSANINPRGIPEAVKDAMHCAIDACTQYPDPKCRALKAGLAERWSLPASAFFCGNGAAEIFYRLVHCIKPHTALLTAPTFGEYEQALSGQNCKLRFHTLLKAEDFRLTERILSELTPDLDLVILCNPNNPTGCTASQALMQTILERCKQNGTWLIVDECFQDFLENPISMRSGLENYDRLVIVRAFTKMYAVPGVRLGWCMSGNAALIEQLHTVGQPWNVSVIAQACGVAALSCGNWEEETADYIEKQRIWMAEQLKDCGFHVYPSEVNYVLFDTTHFDLRGRLLERGIMIRSCENYRGLGRGYFRVAVKSEADNRVLLREIREVLADGKSDYGAGNSI